MFCQPSVATISCILSIISLSAAFHSPSVTISRISWRSALFIASQLPDQGTVPSKEFLWTSHPEFVVCAFNHVTPHFVLPLSSTGYVMLRGLITINRYLRWTSFGDLLALMSTALSSPFFYYYCDSCYLNYYFHWCRTLVNRADHIFCRTFLQDDYERAQFKKFQEEKKFNEQLAKNRMRFEERGADYKVFQANKQQQQEQERVSQIAQTASMSTEERRAEEEWRGINTYSTSRST